MKDHKKTIKPKNTKDLEKFYNTFKTENACAAHCRSAIMQFVSPTALRGGEEHAPCVVKHENTKRNWTVGGRPTLIVQIWNLYAREISFGFGHILGFQRWIRMCFTVILKSVSHVYDTWKFSSWLKILKIYFIITVKCILKKFYKIIFTLNYFFLKFS